MSGPGRALPRWQRLFAFESSFYEGYSRATLRIGLALIVAAVYGVETATIADMLGDAHYASYEKHLSALLPEAPWFAWTLFGLGSAGLLLVALDRAPIRAGLFALVFMAVSSQWETELFGSPSRNFYIPSATFAGWWFGLVWARVAAGPEASSPALRAFRERLAESAAMGAFAAGYVGSAVSKLSSAGLAWADHDQVRYLLLTHEPLGGWEWAQAYACALVESPTLARVCAAATLVIEGGAFLLLCGRWLRTVWALLIVALHVNITILATMPYVEPMAVLLVFAVPWPRLLRRPRVEEPRLVCAEAAPLTVPRSILVGVAILIVLAWSLPIGWLPRGAR